jgi:hypothetical protein
MPKNKKILIAVIAVIMAVICVILILPKEDNEDRDHTSSHKKPIGSGSFFPSIQEQADLSSISLSDDVTVQQIPVDPVSDRTTIFPESHPEYVEMDAPVSCDAGCVFANDKTISIKITNPNTGITNEISFGYITGKCNRFLYLNPCGKSNLGKGTFIFKFSKPSQGSIHTVGAEVKSILGATDLIMYRVLDKEHVKKGGYTDAQHPGIFWVASDTKGSPITYIDVLVMNSNGQYLATLRLTILYDRKAGTFSIVDLDNRDLNTTPNKTKYTEGERQYILTLAQEAAKDPKLMYLKEEAMKAFKTDQTLQETIMDLRDHTSGLYFDELNNAPDTDSSFSSDYTEKGEQVIAVTLKNYYPPLHCTLYFQVIKPPSASNHGVYKYIGRDFLLFNSYDNLVADGYTGPDI